jgi:hypothetical protein
MEAGLLEATIVHVVAEQFAWNVRLQWRRRRFDKTDITLVGRAWFHSFDLPQAPET